MAFTDLVNTQSAARFDYIAIGPAGVYALCEDLPDSSLASQFVSDARRLGHRVERVSVAEAVERHLIFLRTLPEFQDAFAACWELI